MTLQEQYNNIKSGKGAKDVFLKHAKSLFPHLIPNHYGFDATTEILFQKQILNENVVEQDIIEDKEPSYEIAFKKFLAEAKEENEKKIKADLKKTDKSVDDLKDNAYDNEDIKNADNVIFDQYLRGIYTEMSNDPELEFEKAKKTVLKNLSKDPIWYTKNSAFGIKDIGYTKDLPGTESSDTDKKNSDQMKDVKGVEKAKSNVKDNLGKKEATKTDPKGVKSMTTTPKNSKGVKKMDLPGKEKIIKLKEGLEELMNEREIHDDPLYDDYFQRGWDDYMKSAGKKKNIDPEWDPQSIRKTAYLYGWEQAEESHHTKPDTNPSGEKDNLDESRTMFPLQPGDAEKIEKAKKEGGLLNQYKDIIDVFNNKSAGYNSFPGQSIRIAISKVLGRHIDSNDADKKISLDESHLNLTNPNQTTVKKVLDFLRIGDIFDLLKKDVSKWDDYDKSNWSILSQKYEKKQANMNESSFEDKLKEMVNDILDEGPLEDADAQLAKQQADAEAKAAAIEKQRADNKMKIANANKNV